MPHGVVRDLPHLDLLNDEWVGVVDERLSRSRADHLDSRTWVVTAGGGGATALGTIPVLRQLELLGIRPHIAVTAETFLAVPLLVAGTDRLAVIQRRLAQRLAPTLALRLLPLPFEAVPLVEAAWWHPVHEQDAGHRWLRQCLAKAASLLTTESVDHVPQPTRQPRSGSRIAGTPLPGRLDARLAVGSIP